MPFGQEPNVSGFFVVRSRALMGSIAAPFSAQDETAGTHNAVEYSQDIKMHHRVTMNLNTKNSIFGSSNKVQPRSTYALMIIKN